MKDDRKKPLWPWIVALGIGLPVLYVASFGPACWIAARHRAFRGVFRDAYLPLGRFANCWHPAIDALYWYGSIGMPKVGSLTWEIECDKSGDTAVILVR